jgi:hypothetical protein
MTGHTEVPLMVTSLTRLNMPPEWQNRNCGDLTTGPDGIGGLS